MSSEKPAAAGLSSASAERDALERAAASIRLRLAAIDRYSPARSNATYYGDHFGDGVCFAPTGIDGGDDDDEEGGDGDDHDEEGGDVTGGGEATAKRGGKVPTASSSASASASASATGGGSAKKKRKNPIDAYSLLRKGARKKARSGKYERIPHIPSSEWNRKMVKALEGVCIMVSAMFISPMLCTGAFICCFTQSSHA